MEVNLSSLNSLEKLLLTQAVHEKYNREWKEVADIMGNHPLLQPFGRAKSFWDIDRCKSTLKSLMDNHGITLPEDEAGSSALAGRKVGHTQEFKKAVIDLANILYLGRMKELKTLIKTEEDSFRILVSEIDQIRSGKWDARISDQIQQAEKQKRQQQPTLPLQAPEGNGISPAAVPAATRVEASKEQAPSADVTETVDVAEHTLPSTSEATAAQTTSDSTAETKPVVPSDSMALDSKQGPDAPTSASQAESSAGPVSEVEKGITQSAGESEVKEAVSQIPRKRGRGRSISSLSETRETAASPVRDVDDHEGPPTKRRAGRSGRLPQIEEDTVVDSTPATPIPRSRPSSRVRTTSNTDDNATPPASHRRPSRQNELVESANANVGADSPDQEIKEEDEEESSPASKAADRERSIKKLQQLMTMVHRDISNHRFAANFATPVRRSDAPDYHLIVKQPLDLKTIRGRIRDGVIVTVDEYERDIMLMFTNALMYNAPDSDIAQWAIEMRDHSLELLAQFRESQSSALEASVIEQGRRKDVKDGEESASGMTPLSMATRRKSIIKLSEEEHDETDGDGPRLRRKRT